MALGTPLGTVQCPCWRGLHSQTFSVHFRMWVGLPRDAAAVPWDVVEGDRAPAPPGKAGLQTDRPGAGTGEG